VKDQSGAGISGVLMTMTGSRPATTTTAADGTFSFTGMLVGNTYTVTPSKSGYSFLPNQLSGTISNNTSLVFTGAFSAFSISGRIADAASISLSGATVTMTGSRPATTSTAANGTYSFTGMQSGDSYTIRPSLAGFTFAPQSATGMISNNVTLNFTATGTPSIQATVLACKIRGSVSGVNLASGYKVVTYAKTDYYYIQPCVTEPLTTIAPDGTWGPIDSHNGSIYAVLVRAGYSPPNITTTLPTVDGVNVLAITGPVGTVGGCDVARCPAQ